MSAILLAIVVAALVLPPVLALGQAVKGGDGNLRCNPELGFTIRVRDVHVNAGFLSREVEQPERANYRVP